MKLLYSNNKGADHHLIIVCIRRLIKKYGEELFDEWTEVFKILIFLLKRKDLSFNETTTAINLIDIADTIKRLIVNSKFYGSLDDYLNLIDELKSITNESLTIMKTQMKLNNHSSFLKNFESIIIEHFLK